MTKSVVKIPGLPEFEFGAIHADPAWPYITWSEKGRSRSLYVPADRVQQVRRAHAAWTQFWESAVLLAARNREEFRRQGQKEKSKKEKSQRRPHGSTTA